MSLSYVNVPQLFLQRVTFLFLMCHTTEAKSAALCLPKSRLPIPESHITLSKVPLFCDDGVRKDFSLCTPYVCVAHQAYAGLCLAIVVSLRFLYVCMKVYSCVRFHHAVSFLSSTTALFTEGSETARPEKCSTLSTFLLALE